MIKREADISENQLLVSYGEKVCMNLLKDHTTQQNIYWATDSYADLGEEFTFFAPITLDKITSYISDEGVVATKEQYDAIIKQTPEARLCYQEMIRPRAVKSKQEQTQRAKDKAEVFTPAWICNAQNNLIDEAWFGRKERLFNSPDPNDPHKWINNEEKILFPEGKTWQDYVADMRLEITCGEAPYLCNRYDAVTGEYNQDVKYRIGMLDRKLRIVSENTKDSKEWILWAKVALRSTYGFEWQGDNLLLAREALFFTFEEHYIAQFGEKKFNQNKMRMMPGAAYIISWNVWQMDGLTYGLPGYQPFVEEKRDKYVQLSLFSGDTKEEKRKPSPHERFCLIKDFLDGVNIHKATLCSKDFHDQSAPKQTFESIVNKTQQ
ncbi:MAG: restriction endonuclease subunit M [Prevotellaceae bacterium]|nr:restriction endonuclease subunit M [Prevotellaceae bacterium]